MVPKTTLADLRKVLKPRKPDSHKGDNGVVLILAGSEAFPGAATLAATAALAVLRAGVDLVKVAAPQKVAFLVNTFSPDVITIKLKGAYFSPKHLSQTLQLAGQADAVLLGPGMGLHKSTRQFVQQFVKKCPVPMVLDADAIKAVPHTKFRGVVLLTPHQKELELFAGIKISPNTSSTKKINSLEKMAKTYNCTLLLKGKVDIIADARKAKTSHTGKVRMTVGGTGDVLAGLCAAFIALGNPLFASAAAAAYLNGKAGDNLKKKGVRNFIASDLPSEIEKVIARNRK